MQLCQRSMYCSKKLNFNFYLNCIVLILNPLKIILSLSGLWFIHMYWNPLRDFLLRMLVLADFHIVFKDLKLNHYSKSGPSFWLLV